MGYGQAHRFKIHGVTPEFIEGIRSAGVERFDSDKLIAFRFMAWSPEFIRGFARRGECPWTVTNSSPSAFTA